MPIIVKAKFCVWNLQACNWVPHIYPENCPFPFDDRQTDRPTDRHMELATGLLQHPLTLYDNLYSPITIIMVVTIEQ